MPLSWNGSIIDHLEKELGTDSTLYWLFISIFAAMIWIIYLFYYNSRVVGLFLTLIINRFVKYGHIKIGSFSVSVLSGKVMFRDVHLITEDFSVRVQLGFAIFRWWRPLIQKGINEDLSHSETRLTIYFDTFELHTYNRSDLYAKLEEVFGLDQQILPPKEDKDKPDKDQDKNQTQLNKPKWQWRDLIPVIKFEISTGKLVFGNYHLPTTLSVNFRDAHIVYTTKPASTPFDQFMHIMKCRADNLRVMLVPSPKYSGPQLDEAPRLMGEGYVVLLSNNVDLYYYQDEPGLVPYEPELVQLANGDVIARRTWPCMGMDVKCGKGTDISYGPWADRRREELWKFFFPASYQPLEETKIPEQGQRRIHRTFDFKMSMQHDSTLDILFTKNKETQAVHITTRQGTYVEVTMPWITEETGYTSKINGQFMHVDATTSLQFRSLVEAETLEFEIDVQYPKNWNDHQDWKLDFIASKASVYFIFHHKVFFNDLMEDWSSKSIPDLFHFIPYTMRFNILMRKFELLTVANEHNWIDCFGQTPENAQIAFTGETFDMSFNLPFIDYLPPVVPIKFFIRGESVDCLLYLPETNTSRHILMSLSANNKIMGRDGTMLDMPFVGNMDKWRSKTQKSIGWVDCWTTPIVALSIGYSYHPIPPVGDDPMRPLEEPVTTPDAEEQLLIPLRLVPLHPRPRKYQNIDTGTFDPTQMEADQITLELEVGPSVLCVYGSLLGNFLHVKENYFGEDQSFKDLQEGFSTKEKATSLTSLLLNESKKKKVPTATLR